MRLRGIIAGFLMLAAGGAQAQQPATQYVPSPYWKGPQDVSVVQSIINGLSLSINQGLPPNMQALQFGELDFFPFGGSYAGQQSFAPGTAPLISNAARATGLSPYGSSLNLTNLFPHGVLNNGAAVNITTNPFADDLTSDPGYGCLLGMAHISDIANGQETGAVTLCATGNGVSPLVHVPGTFTATQFIPATPTTLPTGYPTTSVWIFSNDQPVPWEGLTNATLNAAGQATAWTTITGTGWYQQGNVSGGTGVAGTPSGTSAYLGWQDKNWTSNFIVGLGWRGISGAVQSGNQTITGLTGSSARFLAPRQWLSDTGGALAPHTRVVSVSDDYTSITVAPPPIGNAPTDGLSFSVQPLNIMELMEGDINNGTGELYDTNIYQFSGTTASGSRHVSGLSGAAINSIYPGLVCKASPTNWAGDQYVDAITYGGSPSLDLDAVASASGSVTITCEEEYDMGGLGMDMRGDDSAVDFAARGFAAEGFWGMGASNDYFLAGPGANGGQTAYYGYRSEHAWGDVIFDYAITNSLTNQIFFSATKDGGVTVDENLHTLPPSILPGPSLLHLGAADGVTTQATLDAFGTKSEIIFRSSNGTAASPSTITTATQIGGLNFGGYDGTAWVVDAGQIAGVPSATWSNTSHPMDMYFQTTQPGSTTYTTNVALLGTGQLHMPARTLGPTLGAGCGAGASVGGSDSSMTVTIGSSGSTACTVAFGTTFSGGAPPNCFANDNTTNAALNVSPVSTTQLTINGTTTASDKVGVFCIGM